MVEEVAWLLTWIWGRSATPGIPSYGWDAVLTCGGPFLPALWGSGDYVNPSCDSKLTNSGGMPSLQSSVRTIPMTINTSMQTPVFVSPGMMRKTRLKNSYCIIELVVSILLNFLCAQTSGVEFQDLTKVERPKFYGTYLLIQKHSGERDCQTTGPIIKYLRTLSQHTANYCHLLAYEIDLSPTLRAGLPLGAMEDAIFPNAQLLELVCLTHQYWPWDFWFDSFSFKKRNFLCLREGRKVKKYHYKGSKDFWDIKLLWQTIFMS